MSDPNASNPGTPEATPANEPAESVPAESFKDIFSEYEQSHSRKREPGAQGREGTVIAVTAEASQEQMAKARMSGFNGFLAKPLDPDLFPDQIQRILAGEPVWEMGYE